MPPPANLRLYHHFHSSSSWRVRIALALKDVDYEAVEVDLSAGAHRSPEYLAINPLGQVPCLEADSARITQSVAILHYLDEVFPTPPLLPSNSVDRARVRQIVEVINSGIQAIHNSGLNPSMREVFGTDDDTIERWKSVVVQQRVEALDKILSETSGMYCYGDQITLADVMLYPQLERARHYDVDIEALPALARIDVALGDLPEFVDTGPEMG